MEKLLKRKAKEKNINPNITEVTPSLLLGLDSKLQKLLIINKITMEVDLVNLTEIANCELKIVNFPDRPGKTNFVSLVLLYKKTEVKPFEMVFHNDEDDINSEAEVQLQKAKKWQKLIN
ncbi:hypothetical protein [Antarcticibacterium sp. W02-3]|nr:hypothetical protein [Antarcticibacterium sp. W02-3]